MSVTPKFAHEGELYPTADTRADVHGSAVGELSAQSRSAAPWVGIDPSVGMLDEASLSPVDERLILISHQWSDPAGASFSAPVEGAFERLPDPVVDDPRTESIDDESPVGPWLEPVAARLARLMSLPINWDGHGAGPVSPTNVLAAGRFLATVMTPSTPAPTIVPTAAGGVQLEWHRAGLDVELFFGEQEPPLLYVAEVDSGGEWEGPPVAGFAEFDLARRLVG